MASPFNIPIDFITRGQSTSIYASGLSSHAEGNVAWPDKPTSSNHSMIREFKGPRSPSIRQEMSGF